MFIEDEAKVARRVVVLSKGLCILSSCLLEFNE